MWNNGKAYFFKGNQYIRYDITTETTDAGYPKPIAGNWHGSVHRRHRCLMSDRSAPEPECPPGPFETDRNRSPDSATRTCPCGGPADATRPCRPRSRASGTEPFPTFVAGWVTGSRHLVCVRRLPPTLRGRARHVHGASNACRVRITRSQSIDSETYAAGYLGASTSRLSKPPWTRSVPSAAWRISLLAQPADRSADPVAPGALARTLRCSSTGNL